MSDAAELNFEARLAAIGGTRQMIHEDSFRVLVALLVDCGAVPRGVMAKALRSLSNQMIAKARGQMESDFQIYPAELFDRARSLEATAAALQTDGRAPEGSRAR